MLKDIVAVLICTLVVVGLAIFFVWCMVEAVEHFDYTKRLCCTSHHTSTEFLRHLDPACSGDSQLHGVRDIGA